LAVIDAHRHPLTDTIFEPHAPFFDPFTFGLNFAITSVAEAGANDGDGTIDPGERVQVTFTIQNDAGAPINGTTLRTARALISGPTTNGNLALDAAIPPEALIGPQPYTINVPQTHPAGARGPRHRQQPGENLCDEPFAALEPHGAARRSCACARERRASRRRRFRRLRLGRTSSTSPTRAALRATTTSWSTTARRRSRNTCAFNSWTGNGCGSPRPRRPRTHSALRVDHAAGATVAVVLLAEQFEGASYLLDPEPEQSRSSPSSAIGNAVLVDYTTDFVMPERYGPAANASPDLDESWGNGPARASCRAPIASAFPARSNSCFFGQGALTPYTIVSPPATRDFLVGSASTRRALQADLVVVELLRVPPGHVVPRRTTPRLRRVRSAATATRARRTSPRYVAANAPATPSVTGELPHAVAPDPPRIRARARCDVPGRRRDRRALSRQLPRRDVRAHPLPRDCPARRCTARSVTARRTPKWHEPAPRAHPTEQLIPVREWRAVCNSVPRRRRI
jgi:hypothetical protein